MLETMTETNEVAAKPRRRFTAEYKRRILEESDRCTERGALGALLRREGLYSSHLVEWRAARERGALAALAPKTRGPKATTVDPRDRKIAELERENRRLQTRVDRAERIIDIQKKLSEVLGIPLPEPDGNR
jgi:transposase-like protein